MFLALATVAHAATSITDQLTVDHTAVEVTSEPAGTVYVHVARMPKLTSSGSEIHYSDQAAAETTVNPQSGLPVVDVQAFSSSHTAIGAWAGRLQTEPAKV